MSTPSDTSFQYASLQVAKPSFSQMWPKSAQVIMSPHHWWASSWLMRSSDQPPMLLMVWCSMPPPQVNSAWPYFSSTNGYSP